MFEIHINEAKNEKDLQFGTLSLLKKIVEGLSDMVDDAEIKVSCKGITIQVMDSMHTALADIFLDKSLFTKYRCDRNLVLGAKLKNLTKVLRNIRSETSGVFSMYCQDKADELTLSYKSNNYCLNFSQKLYSLDQESYSFPDIKYSVDATINIEHFLLVPKIIGSFGEFITIIGENKSLTFVQNGDLTQSNLVLDENNENVSITIMEPVKKEIAVKYINTMCKAGSLVSDVRICMGEESPVYFEFNFGESGYMRYYIAPRLTDNEE